MSNRTFVFTWCNAQCMAGCSMASAAVVGAAAVSLVAIGAAEIGAPSGVLHGAVLV